VQAEEIVAALYGLGEPWRSRFLTLTAQLATGGAWNGRGEPAPEDLEGWLRADLRLRWQVTLLLRAWRRPEER
jgi:hypothetical protein